jgi:enoyl-CoA hydratase/carnithine racemase
MPQPPEVRAIVLTGAGRGFCAGADMDILSGSEDSAIEARSRPRNLPMTLRKPLIGAINGAAAGLGLVEALYCDYRFCVPGAKLTTAFVRRGLIAEYGSAWLLPRLVGTSRALDLLMSGRVVLGPEAQAIGLVDQLVEPEALVDEADRLRQRPRRQLLANLDGDHQTAGDAGPGPELRGLLRRRRAPDRRVLRPPRRP